jgi:hypothetical protein
MGSFLRVRERTRDRFRARLRVLMGRGGILRLSSKANGLNGRRHTSPADSPRENPSGAEPEKGGSDAKNPEYVGEESRSQGEVGPGFALPLTTNLCHISKTLRWVGKICPFRDVPGHLDGRTLAGIRGGGSTTKCGPMAGL